MTDLTDLYQEVILDHNRRPRNRRNVAYASHSAHGHNPLCGDELVLQLRIEGDSISDLAFEGSGCAISTASASLMTEALRGRSVQEARDLFERFHAMVTGAEVDPSPLGKLGVLAGVRDYPARVKCASLCWHTFMKALDEPAGNATVTTE